MASDVFGVSGRAMLRALIDGTQSPTEMADLARRRMRSKLPALARALDGRLSDSDRFLLDLDLRSWSGWRPIWASWTSGSMASWRPIASSSGG